MNISDKMSCLKEASTHILRYSLPAEEWLHRTQDVSPEHLINWCRPPDQPRDPARREECSDLDEKSLTNFGVIVGGRKGFAREHPNKFLWDLKWTTLNDALGGDFHREYLSIRLDPDVSVCLIPSTYVEMCSPASGPGHTSSVWP